MQHAIPVPSAGEEIRPQQGMRIWRNPLNGFLVVEIHYEADVKRRGDWKYRASPKYGGLKSWRWRKEMEIDWEAMAGRLVFENWSDAAHQPRPFSIPDHWPRWVMIDPGWANPTSMLWVAVDVDTPPNAFGYQPIHVYREFFEPKRTAAFIAVLCSDWSKTALDEEGEPTWEWIEAVVMDPMAKQEHQGAQDGEAVTEAAETFHSKFTERMEQIGWTVPIDTGNNLKDAAIEEMITRLGCFWMLNGVALYDDDATFREPTLDEMADGAERVAPTLFVHMGCEATAREMRKYRFRDWSAGEVSERHNMPERPVDKDDHSVTNLIRFVNLMRTHRTEGEPDLSDFRARRRPPLWVPSEDEILQERHRSLPTRHRRARRRGPIGGE